MTQIASLPAIKVEVAFTPANLLSLSQGWTDVSLYVRDFSTHGGRQHYLDRIEASGLSMTLDNRTGFFMNGTVNGTGAIIGTRLPIRVTATWASVTHTIFWGVIDTIDTSLQDALNSDLYLSASDSLKFLSLRYLYNKTLFATYANIPSARSWYNTANNSAYVDNIAPISYITAVSGSGSVVTYTCANSFSSGRQVTITGVTGGGTLGFPYSGTYTIATASSTQFTVTNARSGAATLGGVGYYAQATQVGYNGSIVGPYTSTEGVLLYDKTTSVDLTNGSTTNTALIQIPSATSSITQDGGIEFWVIGQGIAPGTLLPITLFGSLSTTDVSIQVDNNGQIFVANQSSPTAFSGLQSKIVVNDGLWHHVALIVDSTLSTASYLTLIVDGVAIVDSLLTNISGYGFLPSILNGPYVLCNGVPCYIDQVVISNNSVTTTDVLNRYAAGSLLRRDANAADRIAQALVIGGRGTIASGAVSVSNYLVNESAYAPGSASNGTIFCQGTLAPVTTISVLDSIFEAVDTEIGVFFQGDDGKLNFHTRGYIYRAAGNTAPTGAYVWTDDDTSTYHYEAPSFQLTRDDVDTWTTVIVSPTNGTPQIYENTANQTRWGQSTLTKSSTAINLEGAYQTAVYLGNVFATPLARVNTLKLKSETNNGSNLDAMLGVNLQDRITVKRTPINASTTAVSPEVAGITNTDMSIESLNHEFVADPGFWHTSVTLDPYPIRFSNPAITGTYFLIANNYTYGSADINLAL